MISYHNVSKSFGDLRVLDDMSFTAPDGAVTGFVGRNGAGKTTALRILIGQYSADAGTALVNDKPITHSALRPRLMSSFLGLEALPVSITGRDYLRYLADIFDVEDAAITATVDLVGLRESIGRRIGEYSLGMKHRLAIAGCLLGQPQHLVLDEPLNGLDLVGVRWLRDLLGTLAEQGMCILLSSHLLSELEQVATHVVMLSEGRVSLNGRVEDLLASTTTTCRVDADDLDAVAAHLRAQGCSAERRHDHIIVPSVTVSHLATILGPAGFELLGITRVRERMEDLYLASQESR